MAEDTPAERDEPVRIRGRRIVQTNREDAPTIYANNLLLQVSVWDFKFGFGLVTEANAEALTVRSLVNLMISPQHARAVRDILDRQIERYEALYGPIPRDTRAVAAVEEDEE